MGTIEFGTTGFFDGLEFHEFDARVVGIVEIELPFAVAADFWLFRELYAALQELFLGSVDVWNSEGNVIHDAESMMIGVCGNMQHVFNPRGTVGYLHIHPVGLIVFHASMPIHAKAENVLVEAVFGRTVVNNDSGMNQDG
jgi:hypothetical protein